MQLQPSGGVTLATYVRARYRLQANASRQTGGVEL
jgi:hypothetical protein